MQGGGSYCGRINAAVGGWSDYEGTVKGEQARALTRVHKRGTNASHMRKYILRTLRMLSYKESEYDLFFLCLPVRPFCYLSFFRFCLCLSFMFF